MEERTINHLVQNLKNHKDAVIIYGNRTDFNTLKIDESTKDDYSRKKMIKEPNEFWKYYKEKIYDQDSVKTPSCIDEAINAFIETGTVKLLINLNYTDHINGVDVINLKGRAKHLRCMSCNKDFEITDNLLEEAINGESILKCDECGGKISPTVMMFNEKYKDEHIQKIKDAIFKEDEKFNILLNTHTLIFIDVDFGENYLDEVIESYSAIKSNVESDDEHFYTVMICNKDGISIDYYKPEFATYEDIADSVTRLNNLLLD
jgi:NAD-dependent SIR2 family protein deacetylase